MFLLYPGAHRSRPDMIRSERNAVDILIVVIFCRLYNSYNSLSDTRDRIVGQLHIFLEAYQ
jgi:hypothetical protein